MIALAARLADVSPVLVSSLLAAVWQGVLLAAAAGLTLRLLPRTPAAVRFAIWFGVFLLVTALPIASFRAGVESGVETGGAGAWLTLDERWSLGIAAVWAAASLVRAGTLVAAAFRVRALWKRATPVELEGASGLPPALHDRTVKGAPGRGRKAQICTSDEVDRPTVIGFFSPRILIPGWLLEDLTAAELEQIVLHETGHLGRADDWMNLLQKIALVVFPLNPALAWVERRLCFERELAVDERVLQACSDKQGAAKAYAQCLTTLAEHRLGRRRLALALGAVGRESELSRRVGRILRRGEGMRPMHAKLVLGGAVLGLLVAAAGFERCPQMVGFASGNAETVAHGSSWQPIPSDWAAMNGAPALAEISGKPVHAFGVAYKESGNRQIALVANVPHQSMAVESKRGLSQDASSDGGEAIQRSADEGADGMARMVQARASVSGVQHQPKTFSDAAPVLPANVVTQWVVVTTWQNGVGTRTVFATERSTSVAGQTAAAVSAPVAGDQGASSVQEPRYAAVPVRGGWLVFQL